MHQVMNYDSYELGAERHKKGPECTHEHETYISQKILLFLGIVVATCIGIWLIGNRYLDAPVYEILNIQSPTSHLANGGWDREERTVLTYGGGHDKFFVWRVQDRLPSSQVGKDLRFSSEQVLVSYYLTWFEDNGWYREDISLVDYCSFLPESKFLQPNEFPGYFGFRHPNASSDGYEPTVCFAAWEDGQYGGYDVVISSWAPSWRSGFLRCLEVDCSPKDVGK